MISARSFGAAGAATLLLALGACSGEAPAPKGTGNSVDPIVETEDPATAGADVVSVEGGSVDPNKGATPMKDRVAVIGVLNKRNGATREFTMKPGDTARFGEVVVKLRACERTAPWENEQLTGAFVQVDVQQVDKSWRRAFSGWLYKERPALNVVQNPIYDVWPKSCAMTFPDKGPDTVSVLGDGANASSPKKSPSTQGAPSATPPAEAPSASPSNAT